MSHVGSWGWSDCKGAREKFDYSYILYHDHGCDISDVYSCQNSAYHILKMGIFYYLEIIPNKVDFKSIGENFGESEDVRGREGLLEVTATRNYNGLLFPAILWSLEF